MLIVRERAKKITKKYDKTEDRTQAPEGIALAGQRINHSPILPWRICFVEIFLSFLFIHYPNINKIMLGCYFFYLYCPIKTLNLTRYNNV